MSVIIVRVSSSLVVLSRQLYMKITVTDSESQADHGFHQRERGGGLSVRSREVGPHTSAVDAIF